MGQFWVQINKPVQARLDAIKARLNSAAFKYERATQQTQIAQLLGQSPTTSTGQPASPTAGYAVLFISHSMPLPVLRTYAQALAQIGGVMVLRGGIHGLHLIGPTAAWIRQIIQVDPTCTGALCRTWPVHVEIDPILFRLNQISRVPALIYQTEMHFVSHCHDQKTLKPANAVVYGDARLNYMMQRLFDITHIPALKTMEERL